MKNIVITGASGFIGQHLLRHYLEAGAHVSAVVPDPENLEAYRSYPNLEIVKAGFENFDRISEMSKMRDIDIFYYLSWGGYGKATNDYAAQIGNIKPICDAVNEASKMGCKRFLFSTSFSEYMISENETLTHDTGAHANVYGSAKHAARLMAHATAAQRGVPFLSVAFANTFGVGDRSRRSTNLFIHKLLAGEALDLTEGVHLYDWNYIDDTLNGLVLAGEQGADDAVYYIGGNCRRPLKYGTSLRPAWRSALVHIRKTFMWITAVLTYTDSIATPAIVQSGISVMRCSPLPNGSRPCRGTER